MTTQTKTKKSKPIENEGYLVITESKLKELNEQMKNHTAIIIDLIIVNDKAFNVDKQKLVHFIRTW